MTGTVMITTGGTGGHVFPGLAVAAELVARGWGVFWLGTREGMEAKLVPQHGVDFEAISFRGVRGKGIRTLLLGPFALLAACLDALRVIRRRRPNVVLGFGGFASFPGALMGVASGRPLVIHDSNAVAGLANRVLAFGADRILLGFPDAIEGCAREAYRVGRQSAARRHRAGAPARGALRRRATGPLRPAGRRRQPRRRGAERLRPGGAGAACPPRDARGWSTRPGRGTSTRCAPPTRGRRRRRVRGLHRRHGGALRRRRLRDLPRRRPDRRRARRGRASAR